MPKKTANYHLSLHIAQLHQIKVTALKRLENQPLQRLIVAEAALERTERITSAFSLHEEGCSMQTGLNQLQAQKTEAHLY